MKLGVAFTRREIRTVCIVDHANAVKKDRGFRAIDVVALADLLSSKGSSLLALQTAFRDFFEVRLGELQQALLYIGRGTVTAVNGQAIDPEKEREARGEGRRYPRASDGSVGDRMHSRRPWRNCR